MFNVQLGTSEFWQALIGSKKKERYKPQQELTEKLGTKGLVICSRERDEMKLPLGLLLRLPTSLMLLWTESLDLSDWKLDKFMFKHIQEVTKMQGFLTAK